MKLNIKNFLALLTNDLPSNKVESLFESKSKVDDELIAKLEYLDKLTKENDKVFIIGPWGSGKSTLVKTYTGWGAANSSHSIRWASFSPITQLSHAFYQLTYRWTWLLILSLLVGTAYWLISKGHKIDSTWGLVTLVFGFLFIYTDKSRVAYILLSLIANMYPRKKLVVIDDLDRCSLPISDQFALLSNLFPWGYKYIITYGYHKNDQLLEILELVKKLGIPYMLVNPEPESVAQYGKSLDNRFPFSQEPWMSVVSYRDIESVVSLVKMNSAMLQEDEVKMVYMRVMFKLWCKKFDVEADWPKFTLKAGFNTFDQPLKNSHSSSYTNFELSFGKSLAVDLKRLLNNQSNSSNWREVEMMRFFCKNEPPYDGLPNIEL